MPTKMNCPQCGTNIQIEADETHVDCLYCGTSITVSTTTSPNLSAALGMFGNIPGMNEIMQKAMQLKRVKDALDAGNRLEAVKIYREITGASLEQAVEAIEAFEKGAPVHMNSLAPAVPATSADTDAAARIATLLRSGNKIEAIKVYRELTGKGLKESKEAVEALETGQSLRQDSEADFTAEIKNLMRRNKKIDAIKLYRERTNVGLKEAKDAVEALERERTPQQTAASFQPAFTPSRPIITAGPFDRDENKASGCNWIAIGIGLVALLLLGACVALAFYLGLFDQLFGR